MLYVYHCYWWISNLIGLDYYYLLGETLLGWYFHRLIYPQDFAEDILVNAGDLFKLLQICEKLWKIDISKSKKDGRAENPYPGHVSTRVSGQAPLISGDV